MSHGITKLMFFIFVCVYQVEHVKTKSIGNSSNTTEIDELKEAVRELTRKVFKLNETIQDENSNRVMFYAVIHNKHELHNKHSILKFDKVIINKGGHYDQYDGIFVAPVKGIYSFSWTASNYPSKTMVTELVIEENVISTAGQSDYRSGSMTALCKMEKGDHAWIRTTTATSDHQLHSFENYPQTSFLGLLIEKE